MHRLIFEHSFAELVALVLLPGLALYFLNKKKASVRGNAEDADVGAPGSSTQLAETNCGGSSPSSTETNKGASSSSPTQSNNVRFSSYPIETASRETNNDTSSLSPAEINSGGSSLSPAETNNGTSSLFLTEANNGASSSLVALIGNSYNVFLSFSGLDTQKGFIDHLYNGLLNAGIDAFKDNDKLRQGKNIRPELLATIINSKILIPILSVDYGTSSWSLDELVQIMECKKKNRHIVLPIFYKVKPAEVQHQTGSFGEAFRKYERHLLEKSSFDPAILNKWKKALKEVSTLKGYEGDGSEVELVESIVRKVLSELNKKFELVISDNLIGIDSHVKKVMEFMHYRSHDTLFVGIHGMGGIGKTTLAKAIYNKLSNQFEHRSFIANIRESWKRNGVHYLQNQLINDILKQENEICNGDEGIMFISSKFKCKRVLILLDDVDNVIQLKHLAGNRDWFSLGSKIIITTGNKMVLEEARVDHNYEHEEMDYNQSLILFSKHAFQRDYPPREFEDLTHEAVSITGGLPLSLEVFGSLLCRKELIQWREIIRKLKKVPPMKVREKLRISYEALDYRQKQIFLDIACFFIGTNEKIASYMWDACDFYPEEGIEVLIFMSLIKVGDDHELIMHNQLRDLGREIVREENQRQPWCRSRLWDYEEAQKVLKRNKGTDKIEAIILRNGDYTAKEFKKLTNLRLLHMEGAHLSGDFKDSMEQLRWLRWSNCPMNFEVSNFNVNELAILELPKSEINEKWRGWSVFMVAKRLMVLDLSFCESLENIDFLLVFKRLEVLILNGCRSLERIDASIGDMKALLRLELCGCESLTELPAEIGKLKALQHLLLQHTQSLSALPDSIRCIENLEILDVSWSGIEELPNGIESLRKLQELQAYNCRNLKGEMAESMCNLSSLQRLDFLYCFKLQSLSDLPFGLTVLGVTCRSRKLPSLSHLAHLKELRLWFCGFLKCIKMLPSTLLKNLEWSQSTDVEESKSPHMPSKLEILDVRGCGSIETLDVSQFIHLRTFFAWDCKNLLEVRGLDKLIYLESLTIACCDSIERLDLPKFGCLKKLNVDHNDKLAEIQGLDRLEYLERLDIKSCTLIERLDLPKSWRLKELNATSCKDLAEIEGLDRLEYLESLSIRECAVIERLNLPKFGRLKKLQVEECINLAEIQGLDGSKYLEGLSIQRCTSMERLDLPKFGMLKELKAVGCKNLAEIQGLDSLEYLESLHITRCTSIERLDLSKSISVKKLYLDRCKKLAEIQGLNRLESLETLNVSWCLSIERLLLPKSKSLEILEARDCENLIEIQGLDRLEFLEQLNIIGCKSLKTIPKLFGTRIYRYYEIADRETMEYEWDYTDDSDE